jgi:DNA polymerase elongation subunit (family B)
MYRNCCYKVNRDTQKGEITLFTWDDQGNPITRVIEHQCHLYYEDKRGSDVSIFGSKLQRKDFDSSWERKKWLDSYKDMRMFECLPPVREFLIDEFEGQQEEEEFRKYPLKVQFCDIEIAVESEFPDPEYAKYPINVISIYDNLLGKFFVWTLSKDISNFNQKMKDKYDKEEKLTWKFEDVLFFNFNSENDMLLNFIEWFSNNYPDVLTGWNIAGFDIPYIINRMKKFFNDEYLKLSPVNNIYNKKMKMKNATNERSSYSIDGITILDYLELYKYKFMPSERPPSFKLDAVAEKELKYKKLSYTGSIRQFYKEDFYRFVLYNIQDTYLVHKIDEKCKLINLSRLICNIGLSEYETILKSSPYIFGALILEARRNNQKIVSNNVDILNEDQSYTGAFVFPTRPGRYKGGVATLDFNSLYPNIMVTLNLSAETKIGKIVEEPNLNGNDYVIKMANGKLQHFKDLSVFKDKVIISANKVLYINPELKKGLIPMFCEKMYAKRKATKTKMLEYEDKLEKLKKVKNPSKEVTTAIDLLKTKVLNLDHLQGAYKVFLNSIYGQMGSKYFPLFDIDNAEAITISGQHIIKKMAVILDREINSYVNEKDDKTSYVLSGDTDSLMFWCKALVDKILGKDNDLDNKDNVNKVYSFMSTEFLTKLNNECFNITKTDFWSPLNRIEFKLEKFCKAAYFLTKKRYVLHIINKEGVNVDKFSYTGIDLKKTELPEEIKHVLKNVIDNSLREDWSAQKYKEFILDVWKKFIKMSQNDIAIWKGYNTQKEETGFLQSEKGSGAHVRALHYHNQLIKKLKISDKYDEIRLGDRIRFIYINKNNAYGINVIAWKDNYPEEFKSLFEIDYVTMFDKVVLSPLRVFIEVNNWPNFNPSNEEVIDILSL